MVREIAAKSCGAQIKICSNQEQEKRLQDCVVTVAGNLASKQDAACIILEQLEEFYQLEVGFFKGEKRERRKKIAWCRFRLKGLFRLQALQEREVY